MARRRQAVTMRHVAEDAAVSLQTVSRVLHDDANVRPAMRDRVKASIEKLGYVPSIAAQRMSGSRSYLLLALNDRDRTISDWTERQGTDWVDQMLLGGMLKCAEHGYRMLIELVDTHSRNVERELTAAIAALQPDGIILTPPHSDNDAILSVLRKQSIPFARIGSRGEGGGFKLEMNDESAAAAATNHLIGAGHRAIGFIAGPQDYALSNWRVAGWQDAMAEAGLATAGLLERGDFGFASGVAAARQLLARDDRPTAVIASSDQMSLATLEVARELGLGVPRDLSVISFDNTPIVKFASPPLTAIDQPIAALTARAAELLIHVQRNPDLAESDQGTVIPASLVVRESTAAPGR